MNNIGITNPNDGDSIFGDPITNGGGEDTSIANANDQVMADIDSMFGSSDVDASASGSQDGIETGSGKNITSKKGPADQPDLMGMNSEQLAAHFQSLYDKTNAWKQKVEPRLAELESVAEFVHQVYEDPEVKTAFLSELAPDLIKPKDPYEALQEQLAKEFGTEFTPDEEEASKPLTKSWRYIKRAEELYRDVESKKQKGLPSSLKELREKREAEKQMQVAAFEKEKQEILQEMSVDEAWWNNFLQWGTKLKMKHLARLKMHLDKKGGQAPSLINQFGGTPMQTNQFKKQLDYFFG